MGIIIIDRQAQVGAGRRGQTRADAGGRGRTRADAGGRGQTQAGAGGRGRTRADAGGRGRTRADAGRRRRARADAGDRGRTRADASRHGQVSAWSTTPLKFGCFCFASLGARRVIYLHLCMSHIPSYTMNNIYTQKLPNSLGTVQLAVIANGQTTYVNCVCELYVPIM